MPDIFGNPTASEQVAIVKSNRILSDALRKRAGVPSNEIAGKVLTFAHTVTAGEDAANQINITLFDIDVLDASIVQVTTSDGTVKAITPAVTFTAATKVFSIAGTGFVAGDIANILIKGRKV
jgi:hypothetical protein